MRYNSHDIKSLLAAVSYGENKEAFKELFKRYYTKSIDFALLFLKDYANAEDIVSETFIKLYANRHNLNKIERFEPYLFLSIKNQSLNFLQKNRRWFRLGYLDHPEDMLFTDFVNPEKEYLNQELREAIFRCVSQLPPKRRMIYQLIKDDGMRYKEVAELIGISVNTVENHLDLAVKAVRKSIEKYFKESDTIYLRENKRMF